MNSLISISPDLQMKIRQELISVEEAESELAKLMSGLKSKLVGNTRLELILGSMYSGKSSELIRRVSRYRYRGSNNKILLVNHVSDTRYSLESNVRTHNGMSHQAIKTAELLPLLPIIRDSNIDVIGIDEAQFFPDLLEFFRIIEPMGKVVVVAGLDGDFERKPIGQILQLIPLCDEVTKLTAMSKDGTPAIFSKRLSESKEQILVGATESYVAVSRAGFFA